MKIRFILLVLFTLPVLYNCNRDSIQGVKNVENVTQAKEFEELVEAYINLTDFSAVQMPEISEKDIPADLFSDKEAFSARFRKQNEAFRKATLEISERSPEDRKRAIEQKRKEIFDDDILKIIEQFEIENRENIQKRRAAMSRYKELSVSLHRKFPNLKGGELPELVREAAEKIQSK